MVVGSSVGALNGAFYAGDPTLEGVERLGTIWRGLTRHDVFPVTWRTLLGFLWRRDFLIPHDGVRKLIDDTSALSQSAGCKAAGAYRHHRYRFRRQRRAVGRLGRGGDRGLDGDSRRIRPVLYKDLFWPTARSRATRRSGSRCKGRDAADHSADWTCLRHRTPPVGAVANALHALTLLISRQLVSELEGLDPSIEYYVVPPLCPLVGSPYDFSRTADHIERAIRATDAWLAQSGLQQGNIPDEMRPHSTER